MSQVSCEFLDVYKFSNLSELVDENDCKNGLCVSNDCELRLQ